MTTPYFAEIPLNSLSLNPFNARRFEENLTPQRQARFLELVDSVHRKGILEPLLVRQLTETSYEIVSGERRYRAALQVVTENEAPADTFLVPCMIHDIDDDAAFDIMIIENLQREDLTPLETARAFAAWLDRHGNTSDALGELSSRTGVPPHAIRRQVRLLHLPNDVLIAWNSGAITQSHVELLTRLDNAAQIKELLDQCQRSKLTVRELAERIGSISPDLERGFFDKTDCQTCPSNSSIQSGLFADITPAGKCGSPGCFEQKQGEFLTANWDKSKAAASFGTRGYRFGHRLGNETVEPLIGKDIADRCLGCDCYITLLRLTGAVVGGYDRTCIGPRNCFEELYCAPALPAASPEEPPAAASPETPADPATPEKKEEKPAPAAKTPAKPAKTDETGPVFNPQRGEKHREIFLKSRLRDCIKALPADGPQNIRIILTALAATSTAVKQHLASGLGLDIHADSLAFANKIFLIPAADLPTELQNAAIAYLTDTISGHMPVRRFVAEQLGIDLVLDYELTPEYLDSLNRSEIVRVMEEPGIELWRDEQAVAYRTTKYKGKALRALSKEELIDIIINSGANLKGLVPGEILGVKKESK